MKMNLPVSGQERRFAATMNLVTKTDTKGIITFANEDFIQVSGFSAQELLGKNHNLIRHPDMPALAFEGMWKTLQSGLPWRGIVKNRCKSGDHYWVDAQIVPIKKKGQITGYMSVRTCPARADVAAAEAACQDSAAAPAALEENCLAGWKRHLSLKNGIPLWIAFVTLLMVGGGILGITGLNLSKADIQALYHEEMAPTQAIARINFLMADNRAQVALALNFKFGTHTEVALKNPAANNQAQVIARNKSEIDQLWSTYASKIKNPREQEIASEYITARGRYVNEGLLPAIAAIEAEDYLQAQRLFFNRVNPLYDTANARATTLLAYLSERGSAKLVDVSARGDLIFKLAVAGIALSCLVLVVAGIFFFRTIARPLEKAVLTLEDIAQGNLSHPVDPSGYGEPGRVMTAVMVTQMHLKVMIHEIQQSSASMHQQCNQLNQVMMNLAEQSDEQHERIYQTVAGVQAARTAMAAIADHMEALLETAPAGDGDAGLATTRQCPEPTPDFDWMPADLLAALGESPAPPAIAQPEPAATPSSPAATGVSPQVQSVASAARSQALAVQEVARQLQQVARLTVQNREDVQGAWAASQQLEQTARELDELVQYFA